ncbi:hypothetical protein T08_13899 [Trichinella sp. T8]|nr:hypothetical protein T08_13899 [Trichinella sp. T8]
MLYEVIKVEVAICKSICAYTLYLPYLKTTFGNLHFILSRAQAYQKQPHLALTRRCKSSDKLP